MSVAGELKPANSQPSPAPARSRASSDALSGEGLGRGSLSRRFLGNVAGLQALLGRPPRAGTRPAWRAPWRLALVGLAAMVLIAGSMVLFDRAAIVAVTGRPLWVAVLFGFLTDFGTSDWILVPVGTVLLIIAALASPAAAPISRLVLAALAVRLGFVFTAIALPGLFTTVVKRLIGRARPFIGGDADPFHFLPFSWRPDYASLPSGHATNVFAALVAIGLVWPRLRAPLLVYALVIAASRVIVLAHHPSDVIAGAVVGIGGALLVRDWWAARRLGFAIDAKGNVHALPGPPLRRLKAVARSLLSA